MSKIWTVKKINSNYFLLAERRTFICQIGEGGLKEASHKREGDKVTPTGKWRFLSVYYRNDRVSKPRLKKNIKIKKITKNCCWCDDINSNFYNKYVKINSFSSNKICHENLWREDNAYDLIVIISHNFKPTLKNKGSAIFIHCSLPDKRQTFGCVALKMRDLCFLLNNVRKNQYIIIQK